MLAIDYCYRLSRLEPNQQIRILHELLTDFKSARLKQFLLLPSSSVEQYVALSALVARYIWLSTQHDIQITNLPAIMNLNAMANSFNANDNQLLRHIIFDNIIVTEAHTTAFACNGLVVVEYLANLPFPLNIKCLSEALNEKTQWKAFFDGTTLSEGLVDCRQLCQFSILSRLQKCNLDAFQNGDFGMIAPELATALSRGDIMPHTPTILRILQENNGISPESMIWITNNLTAVKNAIRTFLDAMPDQVLSREYRNYEPVAQILAMQTQLERVTNVSHQMSRRLLSWMSPRPLEPIAIENTNIAGVNLDRRPRALNPLEPVAYR